MRGKEDYNIVSSEETHIGRFDIVFDRIERDGAVHPYSYVKMKPGVGVLAFYEGKLVLLKQYRYIWDMWMWEIPGGAVDEGETPKEAAVREIEEETGFVVTKCEEIGICYPSIGATKEIQHLFYAECTLGNGQHMDSLESIDVELIEVEKFEQMIRNGEFSHGMGLSAWTQYKLGRHF